MRFARSLFSLTFAVMMTGCMRVTMMGPNGVEEIMPLRQSMFIQVYNKCAPILKVSGRHHVVEIPLGASAQVFLPAVPGENNDQQEVVFEGLTKDRRGVGVAKYTFTPDWNSSVTRKSWIIGSNGDQQLYSNTGNVCQKFG